MEELKYPIKVVAHRTGLSPHVIRIWEKRYGAVIPFRTVTNRRFYTAEQIERLSLLKEVSWAGHSIGTVAKMPMAQLRALAAPSVGVSHEPGLLDVCLEAVQKLNAADLRETLTTAQTVLGSQGLLQRLVAPLTDKLGDLWCDGTLTAAHEHFASGVIRTFLNEVATRPFAGAESGPVLVVTTPTGQLHELGALLAAATAANLGWRVVYLGPSLPAAEIAGAALQEKARAVALSLVYPKDDPGVDGQLLQLRKLLPEETAVLAGGRAAIAYDTGLKAAGIPRLSNLAQLIVALDRLRMPARKMRTAKNARRS